MEKYFQEQKRRGEVGEDIAESFLSFIPFGETIPLIPIYMEGRTRRDKTGKTRKKWVFQKGENKNRDFLEMLADGTFIKHEVKTDFLAYNDKAGGSSQYHTGRFFVEVDKGCIANLDTLKHIWGGCYRGSKQKSGWFSPKEGCHADWYHFYFPLCDYDCNGKRLDINRGRGIVKLTRAEIEQFKADENIPAGSIIVTEAPFEYFMCIAWDKLKSILEQFASVDFLKAPKTTKERIELAIPIDSVINQVRKDISCGQYDKKIVIVPVCQFEKNREGEGGKVYMHQRIIEELEPRLSDIDKMTLGELDRMTMGEIELIQRKNIAQYAVEGKYFEPFSTLALSAKMPTYSPQSGYRS